MTGLMTTEQQSAMRRYDARLTQALKRRPRGGFWQNPERVAAFFEALDAGLDEGTIVRTVQRVQERLLR